MIEPNNTISKSDQLVNLLLRIYRFAPIPPPPFPEQTAYGGWGRGVGSFPEPTCPATAPRPRCGPSGDRLHCHSLPRGSANGCRTIPARSLRCARAVCEWGGGIGRIPEGHRSANCDAERWPDLRERRRREAKEGHGPDGVIRRRSKNGGRYDTSSSPQSPPAPPGPQQHNAEIP